MVNKQKSESPRFPKLLRYYLLNGGIKDRFFVINRPEVIPPNQVFQIKDILLSGYVEIEAIRVFDNMSFYFSVGQIIYSPEASPEEIEEARSYRTPRKEVLENKVVNSQI